MVESVLRQLADQGLQSDERFTEQYVRLRTEKGYGPIRIQAELKERGVEEALISQWLDAGDREWQSHLEQVVRKKYGTVPREDSRELARCSRFLAQRGFPGYLIRDTLFGD